MPGGEVSGSYRTTAVTHAAVVRRPALSVASTPLAFPLLEGNTERASVDDPGVYRPAEGEIVGLKREPGAKFRFVRYGRDRGGDYAVLVGGLRGHSLERCVTVDRVRKLPRRRRTR